MPKSSTTCTECDKTFSSDGFLARHMRTVHEVDSPAAVPAKKTPPPETESEPAECDYCYGAHVATITHGEAFQARVCSPHLDWFIRNVEWAA